MRRAKRSGAVPAVLLAAAVALGAGPAAVAADCAGLAGATIRWVVPTRPGGGYDAYSRLLQPFLEQALSVRVVIENRPEAGGIVGAMAIRDAEPDGRTLGIINAAGLLAANAAGAVKAPNPTTDFTILASIVSNHVVIFSGRDSGISDIDSLLRLSATRPIVAGVRDAGSTSFYALPVVAELLAFDYELVTGYVGSPARTLALMRGEVDISVGHFDSVQSQVQAGELVPLLQLTGSSAGGLAVPRLAGADGLASRRAALAGRSPQQAAADAAALAALVGAGRLAVAPPALPAALGACLDSTFVEVLGSAGFRAAAERARLGVDPRDGETARAEVLAGEQALARFEPLVRAVIERARR